MSSDLNEALDSRLALAVVGPASAGKDAAIRALFGVDFGEIDPVPGSTETLRLAQRDGEGRFVVVNTPGFQDVRAEVDSVARKVLDRLDLALFIVNAEGGATKAILDDLKSVQERNAGGLPTLVCLNKIDLIRPLQRDDFVRRTIEQLGLSSDQVVATSFDPHPALGIDPIGLEEVVSWIDGVLAEKGNALLFARHLQNKRLACQPLIKKAARKAALAGAVPIPGADITAVTFIQVQLVEAISKVHSKKLDKDVILWMVGELLAGSSKGFIKKGVAVLKTAGWIPGAQVAQVATAALAGAVAAGATYGIGEAAIRYIQSDQKLDIGDLKQIFDTVASAKAPLITDTSGSGSSE
jgi:GTP-binding protein Era